MIALRKYRYNNASFDLYEISRFSAISSSPQVSASPRISGDIGVAVGEGFLIQELHRIPAADKRTQIMFCLIRLRAL